MRFPVPTLHNDLLLRACNHDPVPRVPVWLMRQAGRSDPEYRAYRERVGLSLYDLFRSPEHAVPITLLPQRLGVDALIIYQDILTPLSPMGADFRFVPGPRLEAPIRHAEQVRALRLYDVAERLSFVPQTIAGVRRAVDGALPVLGFAGAPFTLAAFLIEGHSPGQMSHTFAFFAEQPRAFGELMERLADLTADYLRLQCEAGVHAVQLFESMGDLIPRDVYERYVQPSHQRIFAALPAEVPAILFVKGSAFPDLMLQSGAAVLSLGSATSLREVLEQGQGRVAVQGNVDNRLLRDGPPEAISAAVRACIAETGGRGHILNLDHGILPDTPFEHVQRLVDSARAVSLAS